MLAAFNTKVGNHTTKLVLLKLADNANDLGECWPSYQHIADACEMGKSTVRKHIQLLQDMGLLTIEHRKGIKGNTSNLYHLMLHPMLPDSIPVPRDSTHPVLPDSTRTSHSLEPVNKPKKGRFTPPSLEEVQEYCLQRKNQIDPEAFIAFYASKDWMIGKTKMKDWKSCVITWEKRQKPANQSASGSLRNRSMIDDLTDTTWAN